MIKHEESASAEPANACVLPGAECGSAAEGVEVELSAPQTDVEAIEPLVATLQQEMALRRKRSRIALPSSLLLFGLLMARFVCSPKDNVAALLTNFLLLYAIGLGGMALAVRYTQPSRKQKEASARLTGIDDLRAIGPLIEAMGIPESPQARQARAALTPLLPRLKASDASLIGNPELAHFHFVLKFAEHFSLGPLFGTDYILAILKALEQVGDARSIPFVKHLADPAPENRPITTGLHWIRRGYNAVWAAYMRLGGIRARLDMPKIRQAAQECLTYLEERANSPALTLLHPSMKPGVAGDELMRPACGVEAPDPKMLLRAGQSADNSG